MFDDCDIDQEAVDLAPIRRSSEGRETEAMIRRVLDAAAPELRRRRVQIGFVGSIVRLRTAILAASGLLAAASLVAMLTARQPQVAAGHHFPEAMGIPHPWAEWVAARETPGPAELLGTEGRAE